jgi:hypothetical protein
MKREEVSDLERSDGKEWRKERGEDEGKSGRYKEGRITICCHLFVSTPCNYDYEDDNKVFLF